MGSSGDSSSSGGKNSWDDYLFPLGDVDESFSDKLFTFETWDPLGAISTQAAINSYYTLTGEDEFGDHSSWGGSKNSPFNNLASSFMNPGYDNRQDWKEYYEKKEATTQADKDDISIKYKKKKAKRKSQSGHAFSQLFGGDDDDDESILT